MNKYEMYLITNKINGKQYIGITSVGYLTRWKQHKANAKHQRQKCKILEAAIRKYGSENFTIELLSTAPSWDEIAQLEIETIKQYDTCVNGYNITNGGDGICGYKFSQESIEKRVLNQFDENHRKSLSENNARYWEGKTIPPKTRDKIRNTLKEKQLSAKRCLINGDEYPSALDAANTLGFHVETIRRKLRDKDNTDYQYLVPLTPTGKGNNKPLRRCSIMGIIFENIKDAAEYLGIHIESVRRRIYSDKYTDHFYV